MLTPFGLLIRKMRLDKQQTKLLDMAREFNVTSSYLSALEHGLKPISDNFIKKISEYFKEQGVSLEEWKRLAADSQPQMKLDLGIDRDIKLAFGRRFDALPSAQKEEIRRILGGESNGS